MSLFQLGESGVNEITNNLQRIRELAVASANGTLNNSDRLALDAEAQQRLTEVNRIVSSTVFNNRRLLDGSGGEFIFQIGPDAGNTLSINLNSGVKTSQIGQIARQEGNNPVSANALTSGSLTISIGSDSTVSITASVAGAEGGQGADSAYARAVAIDESGVVGLTAGANTNDVVYTLNDVTALVSGNYSLTINGQAIYRNEAVTLLTPLAKVNIADDITASSGSTGVTAAFDAQRLPSA